MLAKEPETRQIPLSPHEFRLKCGLRPGSQKKKLLRDGSGLRDFYQCTGL